MGFCREARMNRTNRVQNLRIGPWERLLGDLVARLVNSRPGPQDPTSPDSATEIGPNDNYVLGEADAGKGAGLFLHPDDRRSDHSEISANVEGNATDRGDYRSGVAVSINDEAATFAEERTAAQQASEYFGVRPRTLRSQFHGERSSG